MYKLKMTEVLRSKALVTHCVTATAVCCSVNFRSLVGNVGSRYKIKECEKVGTGKQGWEFFRQSNIGSVCMSQIR